MPNSKRVCVNSSGSHTRLCQARSPVTAQQQANWQDSGALWHPPRACVYNDKITKAGQWVDGATGVHCIWGSRTLTNLPLRLKVVERSKCTGVCQRCNQLADWGCLHGRWWLCQSWCDGGDYLQHIIIMCESHSEIKILPNIYSSVKNLFFYSE